METRARMKPNEKVTFTTTELLWIPKAPTLFFYSWWLSLETHRHTHGEPKRLRSEGTAAAGGEEGGLEGEILPVKKTKENEGREGGGHGGGGALVHWHKKKVGRSRRELIRRQQRGETGPKNWGTGEKHIPAAAPGRFPPVWIFLFFSIFLLEDFIIFIIFYFLSFSLDSFFLHFYRLFLSLSRKKKKEKVKNAFGFVLFLFSPFLFHSRSVGRTCQSGIWASG